MRGRSSDNSIDDAVDCWFSPPRETDPLKRMAYREAAIDLLAKSAKVSQTGRVYFPNKSAVAEAIILWNRSGENPQTLKRWNTLRSAARKRYYGK